MTHVITRQPGPMGTTKSVCSCGWASSPTNRPQNLGRIERAHRTAVTPNPGPRRSTK